MTFLNTAYIFRHFKISMYFAIYENIWTIELFQHLWANIGLYWITWLWFLMIFRWWSNFISKLQIRFVIFQHVLTCFSNNFQAVLTFKYFEIWEFISTKWNPISLFQPFNQVSTGRITKSRNPNRSFNCPPWSGLHYKLPMVKFFKQFTGSDDSEFLINRFFCLPSIESVSFKRCVLLLCW